MIDRYTRPEMGHIFSLENKYAIWQEIEVLACEAQAELGKIGISKDEAQWIRDHANFEKAKVDEIEEVTRHDVIAFLTNMKEYIDADVPEGDPKPSRWVHYGMTSSDLGDTALCYQLTQACDLIIEDVKKLGEICKRRAFEERNTLCAGRTHGIHAEPMTFGMKFGSWAWELKRDLDRLEDARKNVAFGAISGAVGKALEEGFPQVAASFHQIAGIEKTHGDRFGHPFGNGAQFEMAIKNDTAKSGDRLPSADCTEHDHHPDARGHGFVDGRGVFRVK